MTVTALRRPALPDGSTGSCAGRAAALRANASVPLRATRTGGDKIALGLTRLTTGRSGRRGRGGRWT
jgi:hypothetical protein